MAQREEETELKVPDGVTVCANNCGRPGSPATNNMCPGCFQAALSLNSASCPARDKRRSSPIRPHAASGAAAGAVRAEATDGVAAETESAAACPASAAPGARAVNRCTCCRRRVGLTGFRCRCGELFCAQHRYSDRHDCGFDYKAAGRRAIERENPVVKAAKHVRI